MVVSRSGLAAGYPPFMPMYISWTDCFSHLKSQTQLKRGSSLFFRYYTGPQVKFVLVPFYLIFGPLKMQDTFLLNGFNELQ